MAAPEVHRRPHTALAAAAAVAAALALPPGVALAHGVSARPQAATQVAAPGEYLGDDACLKCHQALEQGYHAAAHGRAWLPRSPAAGHGCETCHGPGKAHADAGGDKSKIVVLQALSPHESSAVCTTCHNRSSHMMWENSAHENRDVGCLTCHSVHAPKSPAGQLKQVTELQLCGQCHRDKTQKLMRVSHMAVQNTSTRDRGFTMVCTSCHNPHGSTNVRLLKAGSDVNESCTSCHAEKRGPFLWEHLPVAENCLTCHDPHGSSNDRLLVSKLPMLCQRCHVTSRHPPTVYDSYALRNTTGANRIAGRGCVVCHQQIHGSNSPSGDAFIR